MKFYFLLTLIDLIILLVYPIAYIIHRAQKLTSARSGRKNGLDRAY
jgi:hypothetical protein